MSSSQHCFSLQFASPAWAQVGTLPVEDFDQLLETLEYFSRQQSARLEDGAAPSLDVNVPLASGRLVAECTFDDHVRRITVHNIEVI